MDTNVGKSAQLATVPEPTDEEIVRAVMVLIRKISGRAGEVPTVAAVPPDNWLVPFEAAQYAAVSEDTLRGWISAGQLPAGRVGRVLRIRRSDIDALLLRQTESSESIPNHNVSRELTANSDASRAILSSLRTKRSVKK